MQGKRRAAVVTDTVSASFYFPLWHRYYSEQVGPENLFVIYYGSQAGDFAAYQLGGLWNLHSYNNERRCKAISDTCRLLLNEYEYVVRVDTDEFLVPNPKLHSTLFEYLQVLRRSYVTAAGYDVITEVDSMPLDLNKPILAAQRSLCYPYDALNKTCIVGLPVNWAPGFHFASVYPDFDGLSLFHLKHADIELQVAIGAAVTALSDERLSQEYHSTSRDKMIARLNALRSFQRLEGLGQFERVNYQSSFLRAVRYTPNFGGVYHGGAFAAEPVLLEIPGEFQKFL